MSAGAAIGDRYDRAWVEVYGDMQELGPAHRHLRRRLAATLGELSYETALDVGCGAGHNIPLLLPGGRAVEVTGIDVSGEALKRAAERYPGARFVKADIEKEPLPGTWDLVLCALLLEHLHDDAAALRHLRAMTGRHLVVSTIAGDFADYERWERQVGHVRNYRRGELEERLRAAGFSGIETTYWGFPFYSPVARTIQNAIPARARYGGAMTLAARAAYLLYWLNSSRRGDLLIARARA